MCTAVTDSLCNVVTRVTKSHINLLIDVSYAVWYFYFIWHFNVDITTNVKSEERHQQNVVMMGGGLKL